MRYFCFFFFIASFQISIAQFDPNQQKETLADRELKGNVKSVTTWFQFEDEKRNTEIDTSYNEFDLQGNLVYTKGQPGMGQDWWIKYEVDNKGNRLSSTSSRGNSTYYYNDKMQLTEIVGDSSTTKFYYNEAAQIEKTETLNEGVAVSRVIYTYNAQGNVTKADREYRTQQDIVQEFEYDEKGNWIAFYFNGSKTEYNYDENGRKISSMHEGYKKQSLRFGYELDEQGNVITQNVMDYKKRLIGKNIYIIEYFE